MKATTLLWDDPGLAGAWAKVSQALLFNALRRNAGQDSEPSRGLFDRLDQWLWRQAQREREAYLSGARDIYELEERIRRLERAGSSHLAA